MGDVISTAREQGADFLVHDQAVQVFHDIYGLDGSHFANMSQETAGNLGAELLFAYTKIWTAQNPELEKSFTASSDFLGKCYSFFHGYIRGNDTALIADASLHPTAAPDVQRTVDEVVRTLRVHGNTLLPRIGELSIGQILEPYVGVLPRPHLPETTSETVLVRGESRIVPLGCLATGEVIPPDDPAEVKRRLNERLDHQDIETREAVEKFAITPEFRAAAARKGHNKTGQVFLLRPEDQDEDSNTLRKMAWLLLAAGFSEKDGNSLEDMQHHFDPEIDILQLVVNQEGEYPVPVGALYAKVKPPEPEKAADYWLPSLEDIQNEYHQPIRQTFLNYRDPQDPEYRLPDLRFHPNVMDVLAIYVLPEYRKTGAAIAMYNVLSLIIDARNIEFVVEMFDEGPAAQLNQFGNGYENYASDDVIPPQNYLSQKEGSNRTRPYVCRVDKWKRQMWEQDPTGRIYNTLFGRRNASHARYKMPNVWRDRLPFPAHSPALSLERLRQLPPPGEQPYLLLDPQVVADNYDELAAAMPGVKIFYAVKCNPHEKILRTIKKVGGRYEIASYNELDLLLSLDEDEDIDPAEVIYSNPVKPPEDIARAYTAGVRRFAFQGKNELYKLQRYAPGASVYIRLSTKGDSTVESEGKFGLPARTDAERAVIGQLMADARRMGLKPYGVAFHVGSQMESPDAWGTALTQTAALMDQMEQKHGIKVEFVDMGGGLPSRDHAENLPTRTEFGRKIMKAAKQLPYPVQLGVEPGRAIVAEAGVLVTRVIGVEQRGDGSHWAYLNVGAFNGLMESLETDNRLRYPMASSNPSTMLRKFVMSGPTCDAQDTVDRFGQLLPHNLREGDLVYVASAGAYTTSYAAPAFNGFKPPITVIVPPPFYKARHAAK